MEQLLQDLKALVEASPKLTVNQIEEKLAAILPGLERPTQKMINLAFRIGFMAGLTYEPHQGEVK